MAPAGDWPSLIAAAENGADSVYFGVKTLNMRSLASNFDLLELPKITSFLHKNKKKAYLTLNTIVMDKDLEKVERIVEAAGSAGVDAVIVWDMAVLSLARKIGLPVHLSTQASVANKEAVDFFAGLGVKRIILARECSLAEIAAITEHLKKKKIPCEIETFVHGAMCVSISGRCFLSEYSFGKSANQGECLQPCRRHYTITDGEKEISYRLGQDYILSPKDLCAVDILDHLVNAGIDAFKIEGRMKSAEYVKIVTAAYRRGIDAAVNGEYSAGLKRKLKEELAKVYNRGFSSGFFLGQPRDAISTSLEHNYEKIFVGKVTKFFKKISVAQISIVDSPLKLNDTIMFIGKKTAARTARVGQMQYRHTPRRKAVKGETVGVKVPFTAKLNDKVFIWRKKKILP